MNPLFELLLREPLPRPWLQAALFAGFGLHLLLVLVTLGTALLAVSYSFRPSGPKAEPSPTWDRRVLRTFMATKSLAVVLGVAPLLLIQVGHPLAFFNATGLFAAAWMSIIALLVVAFISFDALGHGVRRRGWPHTVLGLFAFVVLGVVPGVFAAVLVAAENPDAWPGLLSRGGTFAGALLFHWAVRYLHVLVAGVVAGALFHYFVTSRGEPERRARLRRWLLAGLGAQLLIGPALALSLPRGLDLFTVGFLAAGLLAAAGLAGLTAARGARTALSLGRILPLFLAVFLAMLLVRQHHQNRSLSGFEKRAGAEGRIRAARLVPFKPAALARYADDLKTSYDNGRTIYERSCAFCHSADGDGRGPDAGSLTVPPEDIASIRSTRPYLLHVLVSGIPGTGMPYFSVFLPDKLEGLIRHLDERWGVLGRPPVVPGVGSAEIEEAEKTYSERCAGCHGQDGIPTRPARAFQPPPPSFAQFSPLPARALEIIKEGYPGTMMTPFGPDLAARLGPALVQVIYGKRRI